jgi:hypothetical protein
MRREDSGKAWLPDYANSLHFQTVFSQMRSASLPTLNGFTMISSASSKETRLTVRAIDACPNRAFLIRLEIGEMRNSVVSHL